MNGRIGERTKGDPAMKQKILCMRKYEDTLDFKMSW